MNKTYEEWLKYYENATKEQIIEDMMIDIKELKQLKKQKADVIEYIKSKKAIINTDYIRIFDLFEIDEQGYTEHLLRMLGEIDVED